MNECFIRLLCDQKSASLVLHTRQLKEDNEKKTKPKRYYLINYLINIQIACWKVDVEFVERQNAVD